MNYLKDGATFFIGTILVRYVLLYWVAGAVRSLMQRILIKTEHDLIVWIHHERRARRQGHNPKHPLDCQDGRCTEITTPLMR